MLFANTSLNKTSFSVKIKRSFPLKCLASKIICPLAAAVVWNKPSPKSAKMQSIIILMPAKKIFVSTSCM